MIIGLAVAVAAIIISALVWLFRHYAGENVLLMENNQVTYEIAEGLPHGADSRVAVKEVIEL